MEPQAAREIERYEEGNPRSKALFEEGREFLPGASTRMHWEPFPLFWERGEGTRVWDADGNERLDFLGNNTALPLGHGHPDVVAAVVEQARNGFSYSGPHHIQNVFARLICERVPSMEQVRFTNSGGEGVHGPEHGGEGRWGVPRHTRHAGLQRAGRCQRA